MEEGRFEDAPTCLRLMEQYAQLGIGRARESVMSMVQDPGDEQ